MATLYVAAGINHFLNTDLYRKIMPAWLPAHTLLIYLSGIAEVVFALLLLLPATRSIGAWCLIALLAAVFPANVQMMLNYAKENNPRLWLAIVRLPLQILLILWAYSFTNKIVAVP